MPDSAFMPQGKSKETEAQSVELPESKTEYKAH